MAAPRKARQNCYNKVTFYDTRNFYMEAISTLLNKTKTNMAEHVARLERDLATIRTGRASAGLLENIRVDYYGTQTPIKQMAVINVLDAKTLEIQPWDISSINDIDKARPHVGHLVPAFLYQVPVKVGDPINPRQTSACLNSDHELESALRGWLPIIKTD